MKKILSIMLIVIMLASGLFILTGCEKKYNKEVETYTIERNDEDVDAKLTFELAKELGYTAKESSHTIALENSENLSKIDVRLVYDYKNSASVTKDEKSFYTDKYQGFQQVELGEYKGWSIWYKAELMTKYEIELVLTQPDSSNKVYAVDVNVAQSPLEAGKAFNTEEFVNSEDFQHLLNSIKIEVGNEQENK